VLYDLYTSPNIIRPYVKNNEMADACGRYGEEKYTQGFGVEWCGVAPLKTEGKSPIGDQGIKGLDIEIDLQEIGWKGRGVD
jgi:hypothetical protein